MNVLKSENFIEKINSYSDRDWKPLLELIPKIEEVDKFGDDTEAMEFLEQGIFLMDPYVEHEILNHFRDIVYSFPIMIDLNWPVWQEGKEIVSDEDFDYDTIDIPTKCKIITAIVRNDRFCSGRLVDAFETGLILRILKSIQRQLSGNCK